ncbi:Sulfate permease, Trk-type [hydrothermal vent metagenome]|uniref:Sulfate permease, Trk-type n=1 Tax=hydrothermal vent metagenome TaxID=652676 RepID=A0A3B1E508_9ZZZZ
MTPDVILTLGTLIAVILALIFSHMGADFILLGGMTLLLVTNVITPHQALEGFGNEGLVTVAVLYVVAEGLKRTGGISFVGQRLLGQPQSLPAAHARLMFPVALMSAFMNNTPVVAMTLPVVTDWAKKNRISVSHLLIPLSFAAILGGLATLVGTSTTLVVNGLLIEAHGKGISMFEIAWVGLPAAFVGLIYILLCARWLLPERKSAMTQLDDPREYSVEMLVEPSSPLVGKTIAEAGLRQLPGMYLMEIDREKHLLAAVSSEERLQANDRLVFVGIVESVVDLQRIPGLKPATEQLFKIDGPRSDRVLIEAVVSNNYPFARMTIRESRFRSHYNAAVIAVARNGQRVRKKIGDIELLAGDTLLLEAHPSFVEHQRNSRDFFLVSAIKDSAPLRHERAWISRLILLAMVLVVAFGYLTMLKGALIAAGLMIISRCCRAADARRAVDWSVLLVIGAGLAIGKGLEQSGTAKLIASYMIDVTQGVSHFIGVDQPHPIIFLTLIYLLTMIFTNLITAKAAAVLFFPIAMATATNLNVNHMPFAIAVMIAAAASFATPHGYQTNLMVHGPGGYRTSDYLRFGGPLTLLVGVVSLIIIPLVWSF